MRYLISPSKNRIEGSTALSGQVARYLVAAEMHARRLPEDWKSREHEAGLFRGARTVTVERAR